jgi:protein tyrosine phosphatase (PTP) superfamily phosphohydrolase (DUF442 family)
VLPALVAACTAPVADPAQFRALGIAHSFTPDLDGVFCSGQPTEAQFAGLPAAGIRRAVSLCAATEAGAGFEEQQAAAAGVEFLRIPIQGAADVTVERARQLAAAVAGGEPVLVYCRSSNRVGALLALKAHFVDGLPAAQALQLGRQCGLTRLEPAVRTSLGL